MSRALEELLSDDDFLPRLEEAARDARNDVRIEPARREDGERALLGLQVTTRSPLGALGYHAAIAYVDDGWVRLLGAGGPDVGVSLIDPVPGGATPAPDWSEALIVAYDAIGGFFAINGGGLPGDQGEVHYLAPDTLKWEPTERGHTDWLMWLVDADLGEFYGATRPDGWRDEVRELRPDQGIHVYPPLFTKESRQPGASRRAMPIGELWSLTLDFREQLRIAD